VDYDCDFPAKEWLEDGFFPAHECSRNRTHINLAMPDHAQIHVETDRILAVGSENSIVDSTICSPYVPSPAGDPRSMSQMRAIFNGYQLPERDLSVLIA
jgi:hypothetical protein